MGIMPENPFVLSSNAVGPIEHEEEKGRNKELIEDHHSNLLGFLSIQNWVAVRVYV